MERHPMDPLSLLLGLLAITMAAAGLAGLITAEWLDPAVAMSIAALVGVVVVVAVVASLALRARRGTLTASANASDDAPDGAPGGALADAHDQA
ncbi:MAG TPA: hypothetical protein VJ978_15155 [Nitriliruptoraceae bacterium]|nr:hypothetical protein [Nitriliruptoraceae bacterium]